MPDIRVWSTAWAFPLVLKRICGTLCTDKAWWDGTRSRKYDLNHNADMTDHQAKEFPQTTFEQTRCLDTFETTQQARCPSDTNGLELSDLLS